jgi:DNA repair exonuclease SbcCD ATPase subunit
MAIIFKTVRWKNLLSTGNIFTEVDLIGSSSTLIIGENGAGKSTFIEAISYALYGRPFRKINKPQLVNSINQKNMVVELEFSIGNLEYLIRRGMKPGIFEIFQGDRMLNQDAAIKDYQDYLEKHILKLNHKSFSQIITLGASTFVPFMQLPAQHRREIIEDLLDLQVFSTMNVILKQKIQDNKNDIKDVKYNADITAEKLRLHKDYIKSILNNNQKLIDANLLRIKDQDQDIFACTDKIDWSMAQIKIYSDNVESLQHIPSKLKELQTLQKQLDDKANKLNKEISFYEENDSCPTCKQGIDHTFKCDTIDNKTSTLTETRTGLSTILAKTVALTKDVEQLTILQSTITGLNNNIMQLNTQKNSAETFKRTLILENDRLSVEHKTSPEDLKKLEELKSELTVYSAEHEKLIKEKAMFDVVAVLLKDGGIKSKIIKQYVPVMNKLINKYLAAMELSCSFELDENFNEVVRSRHRDEFSYESFSEGEKARIDLAVLFAWRAIAKLRNANSSNLLILDETFDGSLDSTGTDELLKIINGITADSNVFVISHKQDQMIDKFSNVLRFTKVKNFSMIKDAA